MPACALKEKLVSDMKVAMKSGDKPRLSVIRLILAAIKQIEVDERIELDDARVNVVLDKMAKQRRESITQFEKANRTDLVDIEQAELVIIKEYLPEALSEQQVNDLIAQAIASSGATDMKQMGQVMGILKPQLQGRTNMSKVSQLIKTLLEVK
ncbi:MAG: GatB/YqeY domain-containing protein [Gammaproteobacteria bacterium]|nr:GatB/YqeY domain-containing protein [Gammaproteobacteria bacterium]MBL6998673.1 GatB/YqeY domain-containing protein [Gammaproteobacteria bacterium]